MLLDFIYLRFLNNKIIGMEKDYWLSVFRDRVKVVLMQMSVFIVLVDLQTWFLKYVFIY